MNINDFQKKFNFSLNLWLIIGLAVVISVSLLGGLILSGKTNLLLSKKIAETEEAQRPANLDLVILTDSTCLDCFDVSSLIETVIRQENVKINSEKIVEITSPEGIALIDKYNITKAPTFIVSGEIEKDAKLKALSPQLGEIIGDTFILRQVGAPYILPSSGDIKGRIKWVMLTDTSCTQCYDVTRHEAILGQFGVPTQDKQLLNSNSSEGRELIAEYKIKLLPTIILTGDLELYQALKAVWPQVGTVEKDGTYVFREGVKQMGIYKDLTTNKVIEPVVNTNNPQQDNRFFCRLFF